MKLFNITTVDETGGANDAHNVLAETAEQAIEKIKPTFNKEIGERFEEISVVGHVDVE